MGLSQIGSCWRLSGDRQGWKVELRGTLRQPRWIAWVLQGSPTFDLGQRCWRIGGLWCVRIRAHRENVWRKLRLFHPIPKLDWLFILNHSLELEDNAVNHTETLWEKWWHRYHQYGSIKRITATMLGIFSVQYCWGNCPKDMSSPGGRCT